MPYKQTRHYRIYTMGMKISYENGSELKKSDSHVLYDRSNLKVINNDYK